MTTDKHEELVDAIRRVVCDSTVTKTHMRESVLYYCDALTTRNSELEAENKGLKEAAVPLTGKANGGGDIDVIQAIKDAAEFVKYPANYPDRIFAVVVLTHLEQALTLLTPPKEQTR